MAPRSQSNRNGLKTNERGYGLEHKKLRAKLAREVAAGKAVCWRCGLPIHPREPFDVGHDDHDRSVYRGQSTFAATGLQHRGVVPAARITSSKTRTTRTSRDW